jgi:hypothetical protein
LGYFISFSFFSFVSTGLYIFEKAFDLLDDPIDILFGCAFLDELRYLPELINVAHESFGAHVIPEIPDLTDELSLLRIATICLMARWAKRGGIILYVWPTLISRDDVMDLYIQCMAQATGEMSLFLDRKPGFFAERHSLQPLH